MLQNNAFIYALHTCLTPMRAGFSTASPKPFEAFAISNHPINNFYVSMQFLPSLAK
jgi:hypothetical protein